MTPDDFQKIREILEGASIIEPWLVIASVVIGLAAGYFGSYLKEKGKNAATKEDISNVTRLVEEVKTEISEKDRISSVKYQHKREACLRMLSIIDAHLSHVITKDNDGKDVVIDKQYSDIESARKCHNDLLLSVDNQIIVEKFLSIIHDAAKNPIITLDELRSEVRKEMGYEGNLRKDSEKTWIGVLKCKKEG